MEIVGYVASLLIGLSLGLIGGGGSILTVPILVYLFHVGPVLATSYSLFIVGVTSLIGAVSSFVNKKVDIKTVFIFGTLSVVTVFCIRHFIIPHLPETISIAGNAIRVSLITMLLFAVLMIASSFSMIKNNPGYETQGIQKINVLKVAFYGIAIGVVTGLLGAGGGFLLIPALVLFLRLPIKTAIGTSLVIITINSLIGFSDDITHHTMDWNLLFKITGMSIVGVFIGTAMGKRVGGTQLKKGFGWFILIMGIYIFIHELVAA